MTNTRSRRAPLAGSLAVTALRALGVTYLTPLANAEWAAWRHDHGHLTTSGIVTPHDHPWDQGHTSASDEGGEHGIVFTPNGDSVPGMTAPWMAPLASVSFAILTCLVALKLVMQPTTHP